MYEYIVKGYEYVFSLPQSVCMSERLTAAIPAHLGPRTKSSIAIGEPVCRPKFVEADSAFVDFEELRRLL